MEDSGIFVRKKTTISPFRLNKRCSGSGSGCVRFGTFLGLPDQHPDPVVSSTVRIRILLFYHKSVRRTEIMVANKILIQIFLHKI
jgi:hypothetical protein